MSSQKPTILLFAFPKSQNGPSSSPFCQKAETFLRSTSTPYELRETTRPNQAPKGRLPYAEIHRPDQTQPETIADTHFIIRHLVAQGISSDPDELAKLTPAQKADSRAWQGYIEEIVHNAVLYERWLIDENFAILAAELFGTVPWVIRPVFVWLYKRKISNILRAQGVGMHSVEEVRVLLAEAAEALDARLAGGIYFHGNDQPSRIDLIVFAFIADGLDTKANPHWTKLLLQKPNIVEFAKRLTKSLFPEYENVLRVLEGGAEKSDQSG